MVGPFPTDPEVYMDDAEIVRRIGELSAEEHQLERAHEGEALSAPELDKLRAIEVTLDQCWDLLRQRRARRRAGEDPEDVAVRPENVVEGYRQ
jgi:hypothetical protein